MKTKKHVPGILEAILNAILAALAAIAKFIMELISMFLDFIWKAIEWMMDAVLSPFVNLMKDFVKGIKKNIEKNFQCNSPIKNVGEVVSIANSFWDFMLIPLLVVSTIIIVLEAVEILIGIFTAGMANILSRAGNFVVGIIISAVVGMGIVAGTLCASSSSLDAAFGLMGDYSNFFAIEAGALAILTEILLLCAGEGALLDGLGFTLLGFVLSVGSIIATKGWIVFLLDVISAILTIYGAYKTFKDDAIHTALAPISSAVKKIAAITSLIKIPLTFIDHGLNGQYTK